MIAPTLTPSEIAAVRAAAKMERVEYRGGSVAATDGRHALFAAGSAESFAALWEQAADIRDADAARKEAAARGTISLEELRAEVANSCVHCGRRKESHTGQELGCLGSAAGIKTFASLNLPSGKCCNDCVHVARCCLIFGHVPTDTSCDFFPIRFQEWAR